MQPACREPATVGRYANDDMRFLRYAIYERRYAVGAHG